MRRLLKHFYVVGAETNDFTGPYVAQAFISEIGKCRCFARGGIGVAALAYNNGSAAEIVAGRYDALFGQNEHRA